MFKITGYRNWEQLRPSKRRNRGEKSRFKTLIPQKENIDRNNGNIINLCKYITESRTFEYTYHCGTATKHDENIKISFQP